MTEQNDLEETPLEKIAALSKKERRVLGTLIEKSLTTPEYYPLTLKALTNGCNQKSNRSPLSSYDEYDIEEILDSLRGHGLIAAVQTAGGRSERYRHLLRDKTGWKNAKLAIMGELLLRGKQQMGELRSRASRMSPIDSLNTLRDELQQLMDTGYIQASGELQRRGIDVDHALYTDAEKNKTAGMQTFSAPSKEKEQPPATESVASTENRPVSETFDSNDSQPPVNHSQLDQQEEIEDLKTKVTELEDRIANLERQLGV